MFKRVDFRYWNWADQDRGIVRYANEDGQDRLCDLKQCAIFQTADTAATEKTVSDWTVVSTWAKTPWGDLLLLDRAREKMEAPSQPAWAEAQFEKAKAFGRGPVWLGVEKATYGLVLIQQLKRRGRVPVKELPADKDKVSRAATVGVFYENHQVFHPAAASWLDTWEKELLDFPNGVHDDQVDTASYAGLEFGSVVVGSVSTGDPDDPSTRPVTSALQGGF
jgi:predicted phage terminase large subunit-like protein